MTKPIDLRPDHAAIVHEIIARHLPAGVSVRVFGSRAKWTAKTFSDLDLALKGKEKLPYKVMVELADAFEESDLPFRVDVVDWHTVTPSFQAVIDRDGVSLEVGYASPWETLKLNQLGRIVTGKTPPTSDASNFGGEIPFVTPSDMTRERSIDATNRYLTEQGARKVGSSYVAQPAVVVSCIGSDMGKAALVNQPFVSNQQINALVPSTDFDRLFIYYNLSARKAEIKGKASGAAQPIMNKSEFGNLDISIPDLATQRDVSGVLSSLDDKIELNRRMNETLEGMAQAVFRDWFVDFGPVRRKAAGEADAVAIMGGLTPDPAHAAQLADLFPNAFGVDGLPVEWTKEPLLDQANWINGAAYKNMHFVAKGMGLPVVKIAELKSGVSDQTKFTNTDLGQKYRIDDGELLFSWSGNPDTSIDAFIWTGGEAWLNQHIFAVRENGKMDRPTIHTLLKWLMPQFAEMARNKQTTGLGHVTKDDMKRLLITKPTGPVAEAFSSFASLIFERIVANLYECRTLAETRDYLLPRLMSGTVRVARESEAA